MVAEGSGVVEDLFGEAAAEAERAELGADVEAFHFADAGGEVFEGDAAGGVVVGGGEEEAAGGRGVGAGEGGELVGEVLGGVEVFAEGGGVFAEEVADGLEVGGVEDGAEGRGHGCSVEMLCCHR